MEKFDLFNPSDNQFAVAPRPKYQFISLPIRIRWEVTRRHAYYQLYWKEIDYRKYPEEQQQELIIAKDLILMILSNIGYRGTRIDPRTEFKNIDRNSCSSWMTGALHPISIR